MSLCLLDYSTYMYMCIVCVRSLDTFIHVHVLECTCILGWLSDLRISLENMSFAAVLSWLLVLVEGHWLMPLSGQLTLSTEGS